MVKKKAEKKVSRQKTRDKKTDRFIKRMSTDGLTSSLTMPRQAGSEQFRALTAEIVNLAAADAELDIHLSDLFEKYPRIKTAWEQAIAQRVENVLKIKFAGPVQSDYRNITLNQLVEITGKTRRTIYDWLKKGLARNADGTFNLPIFIHWFERYTISKLPPQVVAEINPLKALKARQLQRDLDLSAHLLLKRDEVMAGQIARYQNLIGALTHKAEELAMLCNGQPQSKIVELLNTFFDELLSQQCKVPEQLRLPPEIEEKFEEILKNLRSD